MQSNLLLQQLQLRSKHTFIVVFCFITNSLFAQNPLLLKSPVSGCSGKAIYEMVSTNSGKTFFTTSKKANEQKKFVKE